VKQEFQDYLASKMSAKGHFVNFQNPEFVVNIEIINVIGSNLQFSI